MSRKTTPMRKRITLALAAVVTIAGAGVAYAYWSSTGVGDGEATTGTSTPFEIDSVAAVGNPIAPGNAGQTVAFTVTNPGEGTQNLVSVAARVAEATGEDWVPGANCDAADYVVTMTTPPEYGPMDAGAIVNGVVTVTLTNTAISQDGCKDQAVPLYFVAA